VHKKHLSLKVQSDELPTFNREAYVIKKTVKPRYLAPFSTTAKQRIKKLLQNKFVL